MSIAEAMAAEPDDGWFVQRCRERESALPRCECGCGETESNKVVGWCFHCDHVYVVYSSEIEDLHFANYCPDAPRNSRNLLGRGWQNTEISIGQAQGAKTMIRSLINFVVMVGFTLTLPLFCFAAWGWGSADERWLMKVCFCVLGPFCLDLWYLILSNLVLRRRASYVLQFMIFVLGYSGIFLLLKSRMVAF
jgi:hypothetical protein